MPFKLATICVFDSIINVKEAEANAITRRRIIIYINIWRIFYIKNKYQIGSHLKFFKNFRIFLYIFWSSSQKQYGE